jgi:penicillin-binding protein 2
VAVSRALTVSSDVFFYTIGRDFWERSDVPDDGIQQAARRFGLGRETGIPLPFEADGRVPDPETRRELHEANPEAFPEGRWFTGDNVNLAIGQGELVVTPLQLASAYATLANSGTRLLPLVARQVLTPAGQSVRRIPPVRTGEVELPAHVRDPILDGLYGVTSRSGGTAEFAFSGFDHRAFPVAGKTGTAQVRGKHDTALFVAFGPISAPEIVVAVVMEESGFGSTAAAPVARRLLEVYSGQAEPPGTVPTPENETPALGPAPVGTVE